MSNKKTGLFKKIAVPGAVIGSAWLAAGTAFVEMNLSKNGISNIYPLEYTNSRFTIQFLDLSLNNIEDITALACLQSIEELNLSGNMISSVLPLMRLDTLKLLDLRGNQISEESIRDLRYALQSCEILSDYD